jgi:hypothetical protein
MEFAITYLRDVTGINVEILGQQQSANQAASLDLQRKQSAMIILQPLFDGLRRYRKEQGRLLLYLIESYLSDGRLIKIVDQDEAQYVPLVRQPGLTTYDVIVDESPSSPNQKEATWLALLKYSPLPTSAQKDISDSIQQSQQNQPPDPEAAKAAAELQAMNAKSQAEIANHGAMTDAKIAAMAMEAEANQQIALRTTAAESVKNMSQQQVGPNGEILPPQHDPSALVMAMLHEFQAGMKGIADAMSARKQIIKDQNGDPIGVAPMQLTETPRF